MASSKVMCLRLVNSMSYAQLVQLLCISHCRTAANKATRVIVALLDSPIGRL